jgi:UDP-GlcNAc:undecaprenyl-phosphate/decaprenyl-phosphate GlcNAc-1-phosphate transferase
MLNTQILFQQILVAVVLSLIMGWAAIRIARRLNLMDYPSSAPHKLHTCPTPLAGGLALMMTLLIAESAFGLFASPTVRATLFAGSIVFIFGLLDDLRSLPPIVKLLGQVLAAVLLIYMGVYIRIFDSPEFFLQTNPLLSQYLNWAVTILWIVGITNAFNFVDSMDGLAVGLTGMAATFFILVTIESNQPMLAQHSALIIGCCLGLYFLNAPPAKLFLGDSGAQTMGFAMGVLAIAYSPVDANQSSSWFVPILLLGVPIFDSALVIFSRLRRKLPVYIAGRDHTYHRLMNQGIGSLRSVLAMHGAALLLGCTAFILLPQPPLLANLAFLGVVLLGAAALLYLDRKAYWQKHHITGGLKKASLEGENI